MSCGDDFGNINIDPNSPSEVPTDYLLTTAQKSAMDNIWDEWMNGRFGLLVSQYWAQNNYTDESRYAFRQGTINDYFSLYYITSLRDLEEIKILVAASDLNGSPTGNNQVAIANILQSWLFHVMTDIWGPIPYSEALKGSENRTPKYDSQRDIYLGLLATLEKAKADINLDAPGFAAGADVIYAGDMAKWRKFAASLILRIAMRMSDVEPDLAKAAVEANYADAFTDNSDNAYFYYLSGAPNNNPLNQDRIERGDADFSMSNILIDKTLNALSDPRVEKFADPRADGGEYVGRPYGQDVTVAAAEPPSEYSQPSGAAAVSNGNSGFDEHDVLAPTAPGVFMNYAEVCFILAEAKERGWNVTGTAQEWYNNGIRASMNEWGIFDDAAIDAYLAQPEVDYNASQGSWQQKIGVQKWISLYMQGVQGWSEWRRLDFDKLEAPVGGTLADLGGNPAPLRLTYPTNEQTQNTTNYNDAVSNLLGGPDKLFTRVWWDTK